MKILEKLIPVLPGLMAIVKKGGVDFCPKSQNFSRTNKKVFEFKKLNICKKKFWNFQDKN